MSNTEEVKPETQVEQELTEEQKKEEEELARLGSIKYLGLSNQGATCYMNSLLQSLYMTYQFRQKLYQWKYNPKKHNKEEDCLPLQLQVLFARLQECKNRSYIDTKPLIHTFGWSSSQMFQQQDVQEFCRVLFDAIEQSFEHPKESEWIRDLYEGQTENFVYCKQCKTDSIRNDHFLDLQLIIRSDFDDVFNNSIEKCMKHHVKSVELSGDNQYFCEKCNAKVDATKGVRFKTLPPIFMLQLNRFDLDYTTFTRKKICDRVYFPNILNMNEFFKKYEDIQVEEPPQSNKKEEKEYEEQQNRTKRLSKRKASFGESGSGVKFADDATQTKKYGSENGDQEGQKEGAAFLDSSNQQNSNKRIKTIENPPQPMKSEYKNPALFTRADEAYSYELNLFSEVGDFALFSDIEPVERNSSKGAGQYVKNVKTQKVTGGNMSADEAFDIENFPYDKGEETKQGNAEDESGINWSTTVPEKKQEESMYAHFREISNQREAQRNKEILQENIQTNKQNSELITKYLQDGPYVYELYAVNVHSGGAQGGHYFSYIKSFESGLWYNFNDSSVTKIRPTSLEGVFGQENPKSNHNTSAYMLMYRQVTAEEKREKDAPDVPEEIKKSLLEEAEKEKRNLEEQQKLQKIRERQINLKIYKNSEDYSSFTFDKYITTLNTVKINIIEQFDITEDLSNWRLRAYSNYEKIMQETFSDQLDVPLDELNLKEWKDFIIEFKQPNEQFEEYDPSKINLNVLLWEESIGLIENFGVKLKPTLKLLIKDTDTLSQLIDILSDKFEISKEEIMQSLKFQQKIILTVCLFIQQRVLKKSNKTSNFRIMLLNDQESTLQFTLKQLDIYNNIEIFVEKRSDTRVSNLISTDKQGEKKFAWEVQVEKESHSCTISFNHPKNNPKKGYSENKLEITIDNRCSLRDAKNLISKKINMDVDKFILKKNTFVNADELKDLSVKLHNLSMIHRGNLFLSEGTPQSIDEFQIDYRICRKLDNFHSLTINYESEHILYMPTSTSLTVLEVKEIMVQKLKELRNIEVKSPKHLRFQERYAEYKTIMRNNKIMRDYQLYDNKVIGITILEEEEDLKQDDIVIFAKFWDFKTKEISKSVELVIKSTYDSEDFMHLIATYFCMDSYDIEVYFIQSSKNISLEGIAYEISNWKSAIENFNISLYPWFLSRDAETFIVRDKSLFQENKTEIQNFLKGNTPDSLVNEKSKYVDPNGSVDVKGKLPYKPTEVALKINLKKKVVENQEEGNAEEKKDNDQQETEATADLQAQTDSTQIASENPSTQNKDSSDHQTVTQDNSEKDKKTESEKKDNEDNKNTQEELNSDNQKSQKSVRFTESQYKIPDDFEEDEDAIMQQILLQSLKDYQNNNNSATDNDKLKKD